MEVLIFKGIVEETKIVSVIDLL